MFKPLRSRLLLVCLALVLTACSTTRFSYRFLDDLIRWEIDRYVELYPEQSRTTNASLADFHQWHRREQLPLYAAFLEKNMTQLQKPTVDVAYLKRTLEQGLKFWDVALERLLPDLLGVVAELDDEQLKTMLVQVDKKQQEYRKEHILGSLEERKKQRRDKMLERMKTWLGSVTDEQRSRVDEWVDALDASTDLREQQSKLLRERLISMLERRQQVDQFKREALPVLVHPDRLWTSAYRRYFEKNRQLTLALLVDLHQGLSDVQRKHLLRELERYRTEFLALSREQ